MDQSAVNLINHHTCSIILKIATVLYNHPSIHSSSPAYPLEGCRGLEPIQVASFHIIICAKIFVGGESHIELNYSFPSP